MGNTLPEGPADGISIDVQATNTRFVGKGKNRRIAKQRVVKGNIKASIELGVVSIADRNSDIMLTVTFEDMAGVMAAAYEKAREEELSRCQEAEVSEAAQPADNK